MKIVLSVALGLCLAVPVTVAALRPATPGPGPAPTQTAAVPAPVDDAGALVDAIARAYREAPALTDDITINIRQGPRESTEAIAVAAAGDDMRIDYGTLRITALADAVYMVERQLPTKYARIAREGTLADTLRGQRLALPLPHLAYRAGDDADPATVLGLGMARGVRPLGVERIEGDGGPVDRLTLEAESGQAITALVDPATRLLRQLTVTNGQVVISLAMQPAVHETLSPAITFDPAGRRMVASRADLKLGEGDPAPDFELTDSTGKAVRLSDLRGQVVVLDFWATWCGPCKRGLPKLNDFARWAADGKRPIRVFAVNMGERMPTNEAKLAAVSKFWSNAGYVFPTLMDYDNSTARAFGVGPIPHTTVVGPDGTIVKVKIGFDPNMATVLQDVTAKALAQSG